MYLFLGNMSAREQEIHVTGEFTVETNKCVCVCYLKSFFFHLSKLVNYC
ncbi:hypothetical protein Bhyg_06249 [Pseudolycoriella hygida]|uniref:Uncharacterized protein n=1 Tax=Pseudolycoriella hygida TaxID=35572 RepID=A0A9Q0N069_9DIPT|nr:hypothetical protein Bhyg_06249 [Pseudolycoriella hygida]